MIVKKHIELGVYYTKHQRHYVEDTLTETMEAVFTLAEGQSDIKTLYRTGINVDFDYFNNLLNLTTWKTTASNEKLLQLAHEILQPVIR